MNCFFTLELPLSTCIGVIDKISIYGYSIDKPSERNLLNAFDELYKVMYGIGFLPVNEDRLTIADFPFLFFIFYTKRELKYAIVIQFTFIKSTTYLYSHSSYLFIKANPTLFTNTPMFNLSSSAQSFKNFYLS